MSHFSQRSSDQSGALGWLARPPTNLSVTILFVLICLTVAGIFYGYQHRGSEISRNERNACIIQARGLPAGHDLSRAMADIHALLTLPPAPGTPPTPAPVASILADLNGNLAAYTKLEAKQPARRSC